MNSIISKIISKITVQQDPDFQNAYEQINIIFEDDTYLKITINIDTDELILSIEEHYQETNLFVSPDWEKNFLNGKIVSYWLCQNHLGYEDLILLGINNFRPSVSFCVLGACIFVQIPN